MEQQIGKGQLLQGGFKGLHQVVRQLADKSHRVRQQHGAGVGYLQGAGGGVQGVEQAVIGGDVRPGEAVEQGGLARVGIAHDGDNRHLVFNAAVPLGGPHPAHVLQLPLQLGDLPVDVPPVRLQLGLAGAPGADGALLALQVLPHARQPGQQIFILGQLHLQPPFSGPGPLGKDVQDQGGAVQHRDVQLLAEHPLLGGGQAVVKDDHVRVHGVDQLLHLGHLALTDEGAGVRAVLGLHDHRRRLATRRLQQGGQLVHGLLGGVFLPGQAEGVQPHQHRPLLFLLGIDVGHSSSRFRPDARPGVTAPGPLRSGRYTWCDSPAGDTTSPSHPGGCWPGPWAGQSACGTPAPAPPGQNRARRTPPPER